MNATAKAPKPNLKVARDPKPVSKMLKKELLDHVRNLTQKHDAEVARLAQQLQEERNARTPDEKVAQVMTIVMSFFIPAFCTCFSMVAGHSFEVGQMVLAGAATAIVILALSVSMPHLAHAIRKLTNSGKRVSWALAIAFDGGVVLSEVTRVAGPENLGGVALTSLVLLMLLSAVLNFIAFRNPESSH